MSFKYELHKAENKLREALGKDQKHYLSNKKETEQFAKEIKNRHLK